MFSDIQSFANLEGFDRVRLEVQSLAPTRSIWAFLAVTNNETQHVMVRAPQ